MYRLKFLLKAIVIMSLIFSCYQVMAQRESRSPLEVANAIGDKLIAGTPFTYTLSLQQSSKYFNGVVSVDFGRNFGQTSPAIGYAFTQLYATDEQQLPIEFDFNDGCKIWLNGMLIFENTYSGPVQISFQERSIVLKHRLNLHLTKGLNNLLIKSETKGRPWKFFMKPAANSTNSYPEIGLRRHPDVAPSLSQLSNWLVIGPFDYGKGLRTSYDPEKQVQFGKMYKGRQGQITWTIPRIEIAGELKDAKQWGTNYNWNYHNGGVAWAMQELADLSGSKRFSTYADRYCDFQLQAMPFVLHEVNTLNILDAPNSLLVQTPLLDFTLAPSLPFINKLRKHQETFPNQLMYKKWIDSMLVYALKVQIRLPGSGIFTRVTPQKYTTWVDDMFMGIPFLVQASQYVKEPALKRIFIEDAADQILGFNKEVFDDDAQLYMHARYSGSKIKLPHWSRANGWGIWAMTEVLKELPSTDLRYEKIMGYYQKQVNALVKLQDGSGYWLNVLDHKESAKEVSGTAIFTMAMARGIRLGWLDKATYLPTVLKGWNAILNSVEKDGTVHDICMGTMSSEDVNYYLQRPFYDNDTHGVFAVLFACMELQQLLNTIEK